ncbi:hypothetical protein RyT2_20540 [Pseudolactococcus yaeyamensis]
MFLIGYIRIIAIYSALIAGLIMFFYLLFFKNKRQFWKIGFVSWFDLFYLTNFLLIVFKVNQKKAETAFDLSQIQLIPFKTIIPYLREGNVVQILGNIMIWIPLSFVIFWTFPKLAQKTKIILSIFLGLMVEPLQLILNLWTQSTWHIIDVDDFILNMLGTLIGIAILLPFQNQKR